MLKVNRRNNSLHYRVYQKNQFIRFELEFKNRQTKLVQNYLFRNDFSICENKLVHQYFKYSRQILHLNYPYADWVNSFERKSRLVNSGSQLLLTSYLKNTIMSIEEEKRLFRLLQFLSFIKSLDLKSSEIYKSLRVKNRNYYYLKFPLSKFVQYTGIKISNKSDRKDLIEFFKQLHKLDPIVKEFSDGSFQSYVCFLYAGCQNYTGKAWFIDVYVAEELVWFMYPFQLPGSFLIFKQKNDLRLKIRLIKALATNTETKLLDLQELFSVVNASNNNLIKLKRQIINLLKELLAYQIIHSQLEIVFKNGSRKQVSIEHLTISKTSLLSNQPIKCP